MAYKGLFRKPVKIEMLKTHVQLRKGSVIEVHPVMAKRLIAAEVAQKTQKALTKNRVLPTIKVNDNK